MTGDRVQMLACHSPLFRYSHEKERVTLMFPLSLIRIPTRPTRCEKATKCSSALLYQIAVQGPTRAAFGLDFAARD